MTQRSFYEHQFKVENKKVTRRQIFFQQMSEIIPWNELTSLIEPHYLPTGQRDRIFPLMTMLKIFFVQQWDGFSDSRMEEELNDHPLIRAFVGIDGGNQPIPDETTILKFRHLLEQNHLTQKMFDRVSEMLSENNLIMKQGSIVDSTLISAPTSTKNKEKIRDPEMSSTRKNNQYYFGAKVHIGVDKDTGLVHSVVTTTAKTGDNRMLKQCIRKDDTEVLADLGYYKKGRTKDNLIREDGVEIKVPYKRSTSNKLSADEKELTQDQKDDNKLHAAQRARVEHAFRVIKRQFGYNKVRFRGIAKNHADIVCKFMLVNLWMIRKENIRLTV